MSDAGYMLQSSSVESIKNDMTNNRDNTRIAGLWGDLGMAVNIRDVSKNETK